MLAVLAIVALILGPWLLGAGIVAYLRRISFHQAFFLLPLAIYHRLDWRRLPARPADPPVIYAVLHKSRIDPALMLSLLPEDTLHILDERSARAAWLEPWREMARTIAFNPRHVFVSRRLVRHLRGKGRLAVYFPSNIDPETRDYRLYRAVAKIAAAADAAIVPVSVRGSQHTLSSLRQDEARRPAAKLALNALEPMTVSQLVAGSRREPATMAGALFDRVAEADAS